MKHETVVSKNVVGRVAGKTHPDQTLLYTAHWDHLGIGKPDETGDQASSTAPGTMAAVSRPFWSSRACSPPSAEAGSLGGVPRP